MEIAVFENAVRQLNEKKDNDGKDLIAEKVALTGVIHIDYVFFMEACESVPENYEDLIPDDTADVYNELKTLVDEGKLILPGKQEVGPTTELKTNPIVTAEKGKTNTKFTRGDSFAEAIKNGGSLDEIIANMDKIYSQNGGKSNAKESKWLFGIVVPILTKIGAVKNVNGKFNLNI